MPHDAGSQWSGLEVAFQSLRRQGGGYDVRRHRAFAIVSGRRATTGEEASDAA
jgi:hypothetical protein